MSLTITTDNKFKFFISWDDLTKAQKEDFDYMDNEDKYSASFIKYYGSIYDIGSFMRLDKDSTFNEIGGNWQGHHDETYFSGVLIELSGCGDCYKIVRYCS